MIFTCLTGIVKFRGKNPLIKIKRMLIFVPLNPLPNDLRSKTANR